MSAVLRARCTCGRPSGIARHANPAGESTPSFRTSFRVTLVLILLTAAVLGHWIGWAVTWLAILGIAGAFYAAGAVGLG